MLVILILSCYLSLRRGFESCYRFFESRIDDVNCSAYFQIEEITDVFNLHIILLAARNETFSQ
jgi:hypothetical protein